MKQPADGKEGTPRVLFLSLLSHFLSGKGAAPAVSTYPPDFRNPLRHEGPNEYTPIFLVYKGLIIKDIKGPPSQGLPPFLSIFPMPFRGWTVNMF